jgi:hypothetical protein
MRPAPAAHMQIFGGPAFFESLLISAYDIHYEQLHEVDQLRDDFHHSPYAIPQLLIIDSGWYEFRQGSDSGAPYEQVAKSAPWNVDLYRATVAELATLSGAVLVSYDNGGTYLDQIQEAQRFFADVPHFTSTILLKPEGEARYHRIPSLVPDAGRLGIFEIIGVTEKDLGASIVQRLRTLAELTDVLRDAKVTAPVHVFGGLDALYTPLYFAAGAEIFDGLSWLRYAYFNGLCINREALPIIEAQVSKPFLSAIADVQSHNLDEIRKLSWELRSFYDQREDWRALRQGEVLEPVHQAMLLALGGSRGR